MDTLVVNKGKVLLREQFINKVFGMNFEGYDRTIDVHIKNISNKIYPIYLGDLTGEIRADIKLKTVV